MDIKPLIEQYVKFIHEQFYIDKININGKEIFEIVTPFLDRRNDNITLYVFENKGKIILTDEGYTITDLDISGINILKSKKRKNILQKILLSFGVKFNPKSYELFVETTVNNFAPRQHDLIQAILTLNDMYLLSRENIISLFTEEIQNFFDNNNIMYSPNISLKGHSGYNYKFDFAIAKNYRKSKKEALILAVNKLNSQNIKIQLFSFIDIHKAGRVSDDFIIINDIDNEIKEKDLSAFTNFSVTPLLWSDKKGILKSIA